jgi:hypothetical protein
MVLGAKKDMQPFHISAITNNLIQNLSIIVRVDRILVLFSFMCKLGERSRQQLETESAGIIAWRPYAPKWSNRKPIHLYVQ